jgi:hypothetical protein
MVNKMINRTNYFYKGFDITSNKRSEKKQLEFLNPYGYNIDSNLRKSKNDFLDYRTNQDDMVPNVKKK